MARSWRATRIDHVGIAEQTGTHEVEGKSASKRILLLPTLNRVASPIDPLHLPTSLTEGVA
jgi:hypothetical protein